ncbi:Ig-like domain-containing protein [Cytobacillus sp.]|uniref:Ig-like domain-containing protein n=1 Tax=Cytobacillus sp. TaxID=2675269 RepID=UPI003516D732
MKMFRKRLPWAVAVTLTVAQTFLPAGIFAVSGNMPAVNAAAEDEIVTIPDMNLKAALNYLLYKIPGADITRSELESFETLDLSGKDIQSLEGLQYAVNLKELSLRYNNYIEDLGPLSTLHNLKKLFIGGNQIKDLTPLQDFDLTHLDISDNSLQNINILSSFTNLTYLEAARNQITDLNPLSNLTQLTSLFLDGNNISDISPLNSLANLRMLGLSDNHISDLSTLVNMPELGSLYVSSNNISDISPLANTRLGDIIIADNQIEDITPLAGLTSMYSLNLTSNKITSIEALANMNRIVHLQLRDNRVSDLSPLKYILNNIKTLDLSYNLITDLSIVENAGVYMRNDSYEGNFIPYKDKQFQFLIPSQYRYLNTLGKESIEIPIELESFSEVEFDRSKGIIFNVESKNDRVKATLVGDEKIILKGVSEGEEEVTLTFDNPQSNQTIQIGQVDLTAPEPPAVEEITDQAGDIRGTAEKYANIEIKIGSKVYKADTYNEGAFHVAIPVQKAGTVIEVFAKDEAGNFSQAAKMTVQDVTGPGLYFYTSHVTDQSTEITGKSEPGTKVQLKVEDTLIGEAVSDEEGFFKVTLPAQKAGVMINITATDAAGNESRNSMEVRDATPPAKPVIKEFTDNVITGTAEPNTNVQVQINGISYGADWADTDGDFTIEVPAQQEGTKIEVRAVDNSGNASEATVITVNDTTAPDKPVVSEMTILDTAVKGKAEPGSTVEVKADDTTLGSGAADTDGKFEINIPQQKAGISLIITAADANGNKSEKIQLTVQGITFPDVSSEHRFHKEISYLSGELVITGFPDGSLRPNATVTRAHAAIMIGRALKLDGEQRDTIFSDAGATLKASGYIAAATERGIITGFPDGTFRPDAPVTRGQMAIFLARAFELTEEAAVTFSDVSSSSKSYDSIKKILADRITTGYPNGTFRPDQSLIRADFSAFMARALAEEFKVK